MKKIKRLLWLSIALTLILGLGYPAAKAEADTSWKFHAIVDVKFVQQYVKMPKPANVLIIDSRPKRAKFDEGYIPTAVSIPDSKFAKMSDQLPKEKTALLIFYCQGPTWKLSHNSAWKAEKMGYTNVKVFEAGFPVWKNAGNYWAVEASYVKKIVDKMEVAVLVDSRPARPKYVQGHLPGAVSIPDSQYDKKKGILPIDKTIPLIFYCEGYTWKLSHDSARKAVQDVYSNVMVFAAGYPAWKKIAGTTQSASVTAASDESETIDIETFKKIIGQNPQSIQLIDVRDKDEYAAGHFKTAVNIPTDDLEKNIKTLSDEKPIVFVCNTGAKSGEAYYMLQDLRPDLTKVSYLDAQCRYNEDGTFEIVKPK